MGVDTDSLTVFVKALGDAVGSECSLVAAGGTALTFHSIKQSTDDVDFVVETGSMADVEAAIDAVNGPPTDLFSAGTVFNNTLPADYMSRAEYVGRFGRMTIYAMSPLDVIMTKIARADGKDMDDIRACSMYGYTANDVIGAAMSYGMDTPELRNNMRKVLRKVYCVEYGADEEDLR